MDILLDTQVILWAISGDKRLSKKGKTVFLDPANNLYFSMAGYREIVIKVSIGKLELADQWQMVIAREMQNNFIRFLPITKEYCNCLAGLPSHHRDPFDRMIVVQTQVEQMVLLTADNQLTKYDIQVIR
jgi:PIN domain nuclease of toxin-antitoxin system